MQYEKIKLNRVPRSFHDLSYEKKFTADMGKLIPCYYEECLPGDRFKIKNECVVRFQPLVAPLMHNVNVHFEYFFVPTRIMFEDWEEFLTGGKDGTASESIELPLWNDYTVPDVGEATAPPKYSLWDYFSLPLVSPPSEEDTPLSFLRTAYNMIWNRYYRDETIDDEISLENNDVLYRRWQKDYFTSALPFQQRGIAPSFPLSGVGSSVWTDAPKISIESIPSSSALCFPLMVSRDSADVYGIDNSSSPVSVAPGRRMVVDKDALNVNSIDLSGVATFNISELRLANQIQLFLELNARNGYRLDEFLLAHFGVAPKSAVLQEPEFLGSSTSPLMVSEVLQTSETSSTSPQGNLAGRGIGASKNFIAKFTAPEHGYVIGIMSIVPDLNYSSQGIGKMWLRRSRYDFYFPEFSHLSEQPILKKELFLDDDTDVNNEVFGYQGIYDEYRHRRSEVCADMRDTFDYWHLARKFDSSPSLNSSFLTMNPRKDVFAVQDEPGFVVDILNIATAVRPVAKFAIPGGLRF